MIIQEKGTKRRSVKIKRKTRKLEDPIKQGYSK
jgi:hypothetical protein